MSLNEKNIQACFQYNASTGNWIFEKVDGSLEINVESPRVRQQVGSDKIAIDLGYSVDGKVNDWKFTIDGIGMLAIKTVAMRNDLIRLPIEKNECAIVTNDTNFRTILWLNYESHGKKLNYSFTTLNSSVSCWRLDEMGKKLNSYDPTALDGRIKDTENRVANLEGRVDTAENNIDSLQTGLTNETTERVQANTDLNTKVTTLEEKTEGFTRNTIEAKTMFTDSIVGTNDLLITGEARFAGPLSVANGQTDVQDFKVNGVVNGELKDSLGFKREKVKVGKLQNWRKFSNIKIKLSSNGDCEIIALHTELANANINSLETSMPIPSELPFIIDSLDSVSFMDYDNKLDFVVGAEKNTETNITSINIKYRNITKNNAYIDNYKCIITIKCKKIGDIQNVTWI